MRTILNKIATVLFVLAISHFSISAQNIVSGRAVDSEGNPVQGALVQAGEVTTVTGFDGTFNIDVQPTAKKITVTYVGFNPETQTVKQDMLFVLGKTSWWNQPAESTWFVGPQALFTTREIKHVTPGIMVGWAKKWGAYLKGYYWPEKDCEYHYYDRLWYTGKVASSNYGIVAGAIYRLKCPVYINAGLGYVNTNYYAQVYPDEWEYIKTHDDDNYFVFDLGVMVKFNRIAINAGCMFTLAPTDGLDIGFERYNQRFMVNVGINYCF